VATGERHVSGDLGEIQLGVALDDDDVLDRGVTLARKIAAIALALWKSVKEYDATKQRRKES
jgi:hypothetical protein